MELKQIQLHEAIFRLNPILRKLYQPNRDETQNANNSSPKKETPRINHV